jgi:hypothetical protein
MNSPFVNFKLKPGISRSLTGAALLLSAAAFVNAGEVKADVTCTLSQLASCTAVIGDKTFSGFNIANFTGTGTVNISEYFGVWTVSTTFSPIPLGTVNGTLSYNVAISGTPWKFDTATVQTNAAGIGVAGNPQVASTITGISNTPTPFNVSAPMGPTTRNFAPNLTNISVSQNFTASAPRRISGFTTDFTQKVPAPLPLLGAGAAFGFSRRLRSRIKTSAAA